MTTPKHQERFQALLDEHKRILYKVCHSYCRNRDDREDLAQEIIVQLWRSFGRFDMDVPYRAERGDLLL